VRRLLCIFVCLSFALSLYASVPPPKRPVAQTSFAEPALPHPHSVQLLSGSDVSYYEEFYPADARQPKAQQKSGILHRVASLIKKSTRKIAFF
jgi:hypothetical protein